MRTLRTVDEAWAAGTADGAGMPPLSQEAADRVAAILASVPPPHVRAYADELLGRRRRKRG